MPIEVECECGGTLHAPDDAVGKKVKCPECHALVRVVAPKLVGEDFEVVEDEPPRPKSVPRVAVKAVPEPEEDEEEEKPRKKKRRKKRRSDDGEDPFWKTRNGLIINGIGLIGLGIGGIGFYWFDKARPTGSLIAGILCIGFGIGSIITGLTKPPADGRISSRRPDEDEE